MEQNGWFFRLFFFCTCALLASTYQCSLEHQELTYSLLKGIGYSLVFSLLLFALESQFKRYNLRVFITAVIGLTIGAGLGSLIVWSLNMAVEIPGSIKLPVFLASMYLGSYLAFSSADSWWLSIPFVRLAPMGQTKKKEILVDMFALEDSRLIELARTGLLDHQLVLPTFIVKEVQKACESTEELIRNRGRKCHEHLKRLESMPRLGLQIKEFHFQDQEDSAASLLKAAKLTQAYILTAQEPSALRTDEELFINLETIATALKPGAQRGEILTIKIQRLGKEPKQGIGYLEDGTMVVVNGGGEFLGLTTRTQVLSQKYSSSGKIIFCNALVSDEKRLVDATSPYQSHAPVTAAY